jgi:FtsP/CotA-like multicopper oxidase with cupredoxin domain
MEIPTVQPTVTITLELAGAEKLNGTQVLVNGSAVADFDFPQVTIRVRPGDSLELRCPRAVPGVEFRVESTSPGVISPREGTTYIASRNVSLGTVSLAKLVMKK